MKRLVIKIAAKFRLGALDGNFGIEDKFLLREIDPPVLKPDSRKDATRDPYVTEAAWRARDVLEAFQSESEVLRLSDVAARTGLSKPTAFRLLHTLERRGLIERGGNHGFRLGIRPIKRQAYRFGYGGESKEFAFSREVANSVGRAARDEGVDLLVLGNCYRFQDCAA